MTPRERRRLRRQLRLLVVTMTTHSRVVAWLRFAAQAHDRFAERLAAQWEAFVGGLSSEALAVLEEVRAAEQERLRSMIVERLVADQHSRVDGETN